MLAAIQYANKTITADNAVGFALSLHTVGSPMQLCRAARTETMSNTQIWLGKDETSNRSEGRQSALQLHTQFYVPVTAGSGLAKSGLTNPTA